MPDVEAKLNITAEYKQAFAAIQALGKALDAVQQRAKLALTVAGGGQGGANGAAGAGKAEAEQRAAVEALSAAMKDAAAAAAMLTESVGKLTPALEAMGPQAEQVQQVLTLAEHYKQLAAAMGIAADAAAKYNASGAQQGEIDARIQKLMEENQRLMDMIASIREEYAAVVRRNAELNRANKERKESTKTVKEELEVTQDLSYQMQLAAMTKRELAAEIERLTKARKEAAKAGDDAKYQELTEELKLARQAMTKLRQEQQLAKIAWLQEAQVAGQLAGQIQKVTGGVMGFGEALQAGTVDLAGMAEGAMSFASSLKAGLGPIGWVMLAVEALSMAWNSYAKSQKEAEEADKKRQERLAKLTSAYNETLEAAKAYQEQTKREEGLEALKATFEQLNETMRIGKEIADETYRIELARKSLNESEEQHQFTLKKNAIERDYIAGLITEEEKSAKLDELRLEQAKAARENEFYKTTKKVNLANEEYVRADEYRKRVQWERDAIINAAGGKFELSKEEADRLLTGYDEQKAAVESARKHGRKTGNWGPLEYAQNELHRLEKEIETKLGFRYENAELYEKERKAYLTRLDEAEKALKTAEHAAETAKQSLETARTDKLLAMEAQNQRVRHTEELNVDNVKTRQAQREAKARKEQEREKLRIEKEEDKIMQQYADSIEAAQWSVAKGNKSRFKGKNASAVNWLLNTALPAAADGEMTSKQLATLIKAWEQAQKTKSKTDDEMVRVIANMLNDQKISDKKTRQKITAIRKNLR